MKAIAAERAATIATAIQSNCCAAGSPLAAEVRSLTILHTNDLHARMMPLENGHGGFAHLATVIRRERAGCKDCILLDAGDVVQGSPVSTMYKGVKAYYDGDTEAAG